MVNLLPGKRVSSPSTHVSLVHEHGKQRSHVEGVVRRSLLLN
jgi:hypothetical protein